MCHMHLCYHNISNDDVLLIAAVNMLQLLGTMQQEANVSSSALRSRFSTSVTMQTTAAHDCATIDSAVRFLHSCLSSADIYTRSAGIYTKSIDPTKFICTSVSGVFIAWAVYIIATRAVYKANYWKLLKAASSATTTQTQHKVESGLLLNVVVSQSAPILQLLASENQSLLVRGNTLLVLDFGLDIVNGV